MSVRPFDRERYSFGNLEDTHELPDLIAIQRESFQWFLNHGITDTFQDISPITDFSETLSLEFVFDPKDEDLCPPPKFTVEECRERDMTYSSSIFVRATFMNRDTGEIKEQTVFIGDFPRMTEKGTFIINGTERVIVSQLVRSPGVIFEPGERYRLRNLQKHQLVKGTIHPYRGEWIEFDVEQKPGKDVTAGTKVARKRRLSMFTLLRALGYGEENYPGFLQKLVNYFDFLEGQWEKDKNNHVTEEEALLEIYKRVRPGEPASVEAARAYLRNAFFESRRYDLSRVGRYKLNRKLGPEIKKLEDLFGIELEKPKEDQTVLTRSEVLATCTYLLHLAKGEPGYRLDDQDHFANRRVRSVGELIQNQVRIGLSRLERVVRERMTTQDVESITPTSLINIRPVVAAIKEFFGASQLSQFMDQVNPLSGLNHRRRLSALGPGGLSRERAGFEVRDVHFSHYGRMCPIETPEGPNIGLIGGLATYGQVNEFGFIECPYRVVKNGKVTDEIRYLAADEEEEYVVAQANAPLDKNGRFVNERVLVRQSPQAASLNDLKLQLERDVFFGATTEISYVPAEEVQLMDVSPKQIVSVATALIPFLEHDDANRALMGANMQRQAVPLLRSEAPYIGTGIEAKAAHDAAEMILAQEAGTVVEVDGVGITVEYRKTPEGHNSPTVRHELLKFQRSNQNTCINQKVLVSPGDKVKKGQVLADGPSTDGGELALGKNLLVAFMCWEGYNFEDAIIVSERLVKDDVLTSVHIHEHEVDARDTKLGPEEITRDIPNLSDEIMADLDDLGIVRVGAEVGPGDVLVGKVTPKGETELTPEERLLRAIFGEKAREVRDTSMKVPHGESGKVIDVKVFNRDEGDELPPGVNQLVRVYVAQKRKISVGDKLAGRHGNKGVISKVLPIEDMPYMADGTPVDIILNPLGVPSRMNVGQVLEAHLGYCARWGWEVNGQIEGQQPVRGTERKTRPSTPPAVHVATPVFDGAHWDEEDQAGKHPTIQKILTNINPEASSGDRLIGLDGKATLYNGRTGEPYDNEVTLGYVYILKLAHLIDDKVHARSTGPYSMITQQPLGGKAQFGGQRFGEMEVWALEAYGAAYCLQELLTIKSDDVLGRVRVYESIVKGDNIPEPGIPESFKVLIKEMQSLCLDVEVLDQAGQQVEIRELDEDVYRATEELGIDLSRPERGSDDEDERRNVGVIR
ncbi:MAG: DNA-directed RNA polymerase subunit beta [Actinomycetota bacterium]|nr:DNA-directed RNA polymerase subunit beta [Acidimicrobiaceae bacterium]MEE2647019.1 DNA-directed RNA polymerase subunit beta [Actinomycetota bacterium]